MTDPTLRAAADKLRGPDGTITVTIPAATADALAQWLDSWTGIDIDDSAAMPEDLRHALAVARSILGTADVLEQRAERAEAEAQQWREATGKAIGQLRQAEAALAAFKDQVQAIADEARGGIRQQLGYALAALDVHQEQPSTGEQQAEDEQLVHVGWWCWRGNNHGHLATTPCRSDNVPLHAPIEWADDMRTVIQRIEDGDDEEEQS